LQTKWSCQLTQHDLKFQHLISDSGSNNGTILTELTFLLDEFLGLEGRVHCFAHIINLIAKVIIRLFESKKTKNQDDNEVAEEEDTDVEEEEEEDPGEVLEEEEEEEDGIAEEFLEEISDDDLRSQTEPIHNVLVKVSLRNSVWQRN
jgi:hypothetical protein